jgi:hypothetical protein
VSLYRAIDAYMEAVPEMDGDKQARVLAGDGRMTLERADVSYASWLAMCQAAVGAHVNILVRT